jgi:hypothetical protein
MVRSWIVSLLMTCPEMIKRLIGRPRRFGLTNKLSLFYDISSLIILIISEY